jgi:4-amino-4-deoxy-L-arabinose transferase-like glycosyltransferase
MKNSKIINNPYLLFFPFLIAFIIWVFIFPTDGIGGDQPRYLMYAHNLINRYYSPQAPDIWLINGPGYPIILIPFVFLKLPLISMTLMNAFFYYFSIIFLFKALNRIVTLGVTLAFSIAWASYYIAYANIAFIATETFTYMLVSILIVTILQAFEHENPLKAKKYVVLSGLILGYIVLTKIIFGYVLLIMIIGSGLLWILNRKNLNYRKGIIIMLVAFTTALPYLIYTYQLTGKVFYWGSQNDSLYWMTTPFEGEYGDWKQDLSLNPREMGNYNIPGADSILKVHHQKDFNEINKYKGLERDDAYTRLAIRNIKAHPMKYAQNIIYNIGRLVFHYPYSYAVQRPKNLLVFPINGILFTLMLFSLIPTFINWRKIPISLRYLMFIALIYLGGSAIITALVRMFTIIVPILLVWIAFIVQNTLKINLKFRENAKHIT